MTGRERLTAIMDRKPVDRIAWTTLVDDITRSVMPPEIRQMPVLDFYRHIGCDFAAFGNYGLPPELQVKPPCRFFRPGVEDTWEHRPNGTSERKTRTPRGTLTAEFRNWHPVKYPVTTREDLRLLTDIWVNTKCEEIAGEAESSYRRVDEAIGELGVYAYAFDPTPLQAVLEFDMGLEKCYELMNDWPDEFDELMAVMHARRIQEYEICARRLPCRTFIAVENTSTTMVSPAIYGKHGLPQVKGFVDVMHRHGKLACLHMCGLIRDILPLIRQTGADAVNALTPPPIGNTWPEETLDVLGDDAIVWGAILDGNVFQSTSFARAKLEAALDRLFTPRVRRANFLLWVAADGLATPLDRFLMVRDWIEAHGQSGRRRPGRLDHACSVIPPPSGNGDRRQGRRWCR